MLFAFLAGITFIVIGSEVKPADQPVVTLHYNMQGSECGAEVIAVRTNTQQLDGTSVLFLLRVKNMGNATDTFQISAEDFNQYEENPDGSDPENNIPLNQQLEDLNNNPINGEITLSPGESYDFYLKLSRPFGAEYDVWNGTKITAVSQSCPDNPGSTIVYTYIPVPEGVIIGCADPTISTDSFSNNSDMVALLMPDYSGLPNRNILSL